MTADRDEHVVKQHAGTEKLAVAMLVVSTAAT